MSALTDRHIAQLLDDAVSPWISPTPTIETILSGKQEFQHGELWGWGTFIPEDVKERWESLSVETRIVAYCVAVEGVERVCRLSETE